MQTRWQSFNFVKCKRDAEHPSIIPVESTTNHQAPREGPMTRARARAIETEVNSFLFDLHWNSHENWVQPQRETLCIHRYQRDGRRKLAGSHKQPRREKEELQDTPQVPAPSTPE